jgi:hypothetical protein
MIRNVRIDKLPLQQMEYMKKGGKTKSKAKTKTISQQQSVSQKVHIHIGNQRHPAHHSRRVRISNGNLAMENALIKMLQRVVPPIQSAGQISFNPIIVSGLPPLVNQGIKTAPPSQELPSQQRNIANLADVHLEKLHQDQVKLQEWRNQELLSRASHLPTSIDSGDASSIRSLPFTHLSYGDEYNSSTSSILSSEHYFDATTGRLVKEERLSSDQPTIREVDEKQEAKHPLHLPFPSNPSISDVSTVIPQQSMSIQVGNPVPFAEASSSLRKKPIPSQFPPGFNPYPNSSSSSSSTTPHDNFKELGKFSFQELDDMYLRRKHEKNGKMSLERFAHKNDIVFPRNMKKEQVVSYIYDQLKQRNMAK